MATVFFIYGLAFFILGVTIAIYPKKHSKFWLAHNLWLIASFGILHGLNEWVDLLIIIQKPLDISSLQIVKSFLLLLSFVFLLQFGIKSIIEVNKKSPILKAIPVIPLIVWASIVFSSDQWFLMADVWARYLFAIPGALLTSYALMMQSTEIKKIGLSRPIIYLTLSALGFFFYSFFSGLIVPDGRFVPATILNYTMFAGTIGLQVQVFRTLCASVIAFGLIKVLGVFEWETIEALRKSRDEIEIEVKQRTHDLNETNKELERQITERKKLQDLIVSAKKEWEESFDIINDAITIHDKDFNIIRANKAVTKLLGLSFREIIGQKCYRLYHGTDSRPEGCPSCLALKTGIPAAIEMFEPHLDKFLEIKAFPKVDENNHIFTLVHVIRDITERKGMEDALRDSERLLRESQRVARLGSYAFDVKSGTWRSSQILDEIFGIGKEYPRDVEGWAFLVHPEFRSQMVKYFSEEVLTKKQRFDKQYKIVRLSDQEERWVHGVGDLEFDENGNVVRMVGTIQDITDYKNMETEIMKAQKLESIGLLAGGIAHDFNNLLQGILGNISLAREFTNPKDRISPLLEESEKAVVQAKELSYQLLTFSKGGLSDRRATSIRSLLREAVSLSLSGSNIACEFNLPEDLDPVEVDKVQIKQVFNNLLINAKEAMPDGGTVEISAWNVRITRNDNLPLKDGNYVKISVADHGSGIPEKNLPRIFDPYFSTKGRGSQKGMGLGLSICHSVITKHEGHIAVESKVGVGTIFHIFFPVSATVPFDEETAKNKKLVTGKGRVLLMDDVEMVRRITGAMLRQLGYEVEFARNGEEAIEACRNARAAGLPFNVAILDLTVQGGMGGERALRELKKTDPEVKAVASSGYTDDPVMKDFKSYGFVNAIAKPYTLEELNGLLSELHLDNS